jgi:hypothetical protein
LRITITAVRTGCGKTGGNSFMLAISFPDIKLLTSHLFIKDSFDTFLLREASISTANTYTINGKLNESFFDSEEWAETKEKEYITWALVKPLCCELIKGKKLPLRFSITMKLSASNTVNFIRQTKLKISPEELSGLFLHIRYEKGLLTANTGISFSTFIMDKSTEHAWDDMILKFFKQKEIIFISTHSC